MIQTVFPLSVCVCDTYAWRLTQTNATLEFLEAAPAARRVPSSVNIKLSTIFNAAPRRKANTRCRGIRRAVRWRTIAHLAVGRFKLAAVTPYGGFTPNASASNAIAL